MLPTLAERRSAALSLGWRRVAAVLLVAVLFPSLALAQQEVVMFTAVDNAQQEILKRIRDEKVRLDIATWYLNDGEIMMAIANKHLSGVPVRVIGDRGALFDADPQTRAQFEYLANAGVPIKLRYHPTWFPEIMHWKAGIFAGQASVEFGSANWTTFELVPFSSTDFKDETAMFTNDQALVRAFMTKFDDMWVDTATFLDWNDAYLLETGQPWKGAKPMTIPQGRAEQVYNTNLPDMVWEQGQNLADRMVQEINRETSAIDFVVYRLSVPRIADALIQKKQAGVNVRVIVEPSQYRNTLYPEYEMTGAMMDRLWLAGIPLKIRTHQGLTHMKTLITSHVAMNGSSNFTAFWQRDHNYFIPAATKPLLHQSMRDRFNIMWNDTANFADFQPQLPQEPTQLQPATGSFSVSTLPKLEWYRSRWATSFDVHLGTSPGNMAPVARVNAVVSETPPETYSFTPAQALLPNTTYYWRVWSRTYATDVRANLTQPSEIWSFTTAAGPGGGGGSGPYTGTPVPLPGTIQAENFDNGGAGVAYVDTTSGNSGGVYRTGDVDVEATTDTGGGYNVGWITTGEWLKYSVSVTAAGTYDLEFRVASSGTGGTFHLESNGVNLTGPIAVPDTGGWQTWATVKKTGVTLPAGLQIWTLVVDSATAGAVGNLNYIRVLTGSGGPTDPPPPPATTPYSGTPLALPGTVQAEAFDNGPMGQAYQDTTTGNSGGAFRTTNADIEPANDTGGGHNIGWAVAGEWLQYSVNVTAAGSYDLEFRVASAGNGGTFHLEVNGTNVTGSLTVPNSGGWQTWTTVKKTAVTLAAGAQTWRLVLDSNGASGGVGNFNYINVVAAGTTPPPPTAPEIVIHGADIVQANLHGTWSRTTDATAAASIAITSANQGAGTVSTPLANPVNYVDVPFTAQAGVRYRLWLRMKALNDDKFNDSLYVQFSGSVDGGGSPRYRIGTTQGLNVNQATCADCPPTGWGWQNRGYWEVDTGEIWFATSGAQTLRIQIREDGVGFDQIILSPQRFVDAAPGPPVNDTTIIPSSR